MGIYNKFATTSRNAKEQEARRKLATIESMIARTTDPEARAGLERRKRELEREIAAYDTKKQAHARSLWHSIIEKRANNGRETR